MSSYICIIPPLAPPKQYYIYPKNRLTALCRMTVRRIEMIISWALPIASKAFKRGERKPPAVCFSGRRGRRPLPLGVGYNHAGRGLLARGG